MKHLLNILNNTRFCKQATKEVNVGISFRPNSLYLCYILPCGFWARLPMRSWSQLTGLPVTTIYDRFEKGRPMSRVLDPRTFKSSGRPKNA